jgi:hypothetical protein
MLLIAALGRQRQGDFWVWGQPDLQSEFQDSQGYTEKPCFKKKKKITWIISFYFPTAYQVETSLHHLPFESKQTEAKVAWLERESQIKA